MEQQAVVDHLRPERRIREPALQDQLKRAPLIRGVRGRGGHHAARRIGPGGDHVDLVARVRVGVRPRRRGVRAGWRVLVEDPPVDDRLTVLARRVAPAEVALGDTHLEAIPCRPAQVERPAAFGQPRDAVLAERIVATHGREVVEPPAIAAHRLVRRTPLPLGKVGPPAGIELIPRREVSSRRGEQRPADQGRGQEHRTPRDDRQAASCRGSHLAAAL